MTQQYKSALILVDLQIDFCHGGSLAIPDGDAVIPLANKLQPYFDLVVATKDWHPQNHVSFASNHPGKKIGDVINVHGINQILWPDHCVQNTNGSEFHPKLNTQCIAHVFHKGTNPHVDSYSTFFDNEHLRETGLENYLHKKHITEIFIMGLATDYCVKYSCLDAVKLNFKVNVIEDGCRGVELHAGDVKTALDEIKKAGGNIIHSSFILKS